MNATDELMSTMSLKIVSDLMKSGLSPHEGMLVLCRTVISGFYAEGLSKEEAIGRLIEVVHITYNCADQLFNKGELQ